MSQIKQIEPVPPLSNSFSYSAINRLDDTHSRWWEPSFLDQSIQMPISFRNHLTNTPRNNVYQISGHPSIELHITLTITFKHLHTVFHSSIMLHSCQQHTVVPLLSHPLPTFSSLFLRFTPNNTGRFNSPHLDYGILSSYDYTAIHYLSTKGSI